MRVNNPRGPRPRAAVAIATLAAALAACTCKSQPTEPGPGEAPAKSEASPAGEVADEPLPELRSGADAPSEGRALSGDLLAKRVDRGATYLELRLPIKGDESGIEWDRLHVELADAVPGQVAVIAGTNGGQAVTILVRAGDGKAPASGPISGAIYGVRWSEGRRGWIRLPFTAIPAGALGDPPELPRRWAEAAGEALTGTLWLDRSASARHPWDHFAAGRLLTLVDRTGSSRGPGGDRPPARTDLVRLMDTTSGILSIQEALQHDRGLRLGSDEGPRTVPLGELAGPPLAEHPFAAMQAALPDPAAGAPERLAAAAPADFWYARAATLPLLLRLLDEADTWITPLVALLQQNPEDRGLTGRYELELGLRRGEFAKIVGPLAVGEVAIVGSDPYVREGTDVTMIFEVRQADLYNAELDRYRQGLTDHLATQGSGVTATTRVYEGVTIESTSDASGRLRQERALTEGLGLVSNSPRAIERVIDAIAGRRPRLADSADFRYMRAREGGARHDFTVFLSDAVIAAVVGPAQKIQAARREEALAELLVPGYAALLYGWLYGQAPADLAALTASGLLGADELRHRGGEAIAFAPPRLAADLMPPEDTTRSRWGTPARLTSLLDLPPVTGVSEAERRAYEDFARTYQTYWKRFIDPIAINLDLAAAAGGGETIDLDVRILPLIDATDYRELTETVGDTRVSVSAIGRGLQVVWGVGAESPIRRDLDGLLRASTGKSEIGIGWVGDWVTVGIEDRAALAELYVWVDERLQRPNPAREDDIFRDDELWRRLGKAPVYAGAAVKNPAALVATLGALRTMINEIAPGTIEWGEHSKHRDLPIVRVGVRRDAPLLSKPELADAVALYYVQTGSAIVFAVDPGILHPVIDRLLADQAPKVGDADGPQLVIDGGSARDRPLWTVLYWLLQAEAMTAQTSAERAAEILLRGAPGAGSPALVGRLGGAYFGSAPLSARGAPPSVLDPTGAADPAFGTAIRRIYPELPLAGSPVDRLMGRLEGARVEVSFDHEPAAAGADARSLHTHLQLRLSAP